MNSPPANQTATRHPFVEHPHRTFVGLSVPILFSMIAEPLTGLVDTAFVQQLGAAPAAALGVGTLVLSSVLWIFNFLAIGCQTEVARADGAGRSDRAREICGLALLLGGACGCLLIVCGEPLAAPTAALMGAAGETLTGATTYLRIRLLAAPALLGMAVAFGALRGLQDMRTPLWIAVVTNALNMVLDALWIPRFGIAGAAWATVASQVAGASWALVAVYRRLGLPRRLRSGDARLLIVVGRDLFLRTSLLLLFLLIATRAATRAGVASGAAHQAIRSVWQFTAFLLDAFALTAQSLVGYFLGAGDPPRARRVAAIACWWGLGTGVLLAVAMALSQGLVESLLVADRALAVFGAAWLVAAAFQPLNAISFVTDGIHWGTADYRWLRNAMILATGTGGLWLWWIDETEADALVWIWLATGGWITIRAGFGFARILPGLGSPLYHDPPPAFRERSESADANFRPPSGGPRRYTQAMRRLDRDDRMRLLKFVCTFAWTDLRVTPEEKALVDRMVAGEEFTDDERAQVRGWLEVPPPPEDVDPTLVPRDHREQFVDAVREIIVADGRVVPAERDSLRVFEELLQD